MDIFDLIYYVTLLCLPIAPYFLFFKQRTENPRLYTSRDWFYLFKYVLASSAIKKIKKKNVFTSNLNTIEDVIRIQSDIFSDNQFIYGVDQKGNNISLKFTIRSNLVAELFVCLRTADGATYTFPGDEVTKVCSISDWSWKSKDLSFDILEPLKRIRIFFNGLLQDDKKKIQHVQFNFIWVAAGSAQFYPYDIATFPLADSLARHRWKDGNWIALQGDQKGYDQFGLLRGFVKGDSFSEDLMLSLPSCRSRFWCTDERLTVDRSCHLFLVAQDGLLVNLWMKNLRNGCKGLQYGSIIAADGRISPIEGSDLRLDILSQDCPPTCFSINIKTRRKVTRTVFHLNDRKIIGDQITKLLNVPADCDINTQQGKSILELWHRPEKLRPPPPPLLTENKTKTLPNCYVTNFTDDIARIIGLTGGKGCSLALLSSLENDDFKVPEGFVVTVNAFIAQVENNFKIKKTIAMLDDLCCGRIKGDLETACVETVNTFKNEPMLLEIRTAILKLVDNTVDNNGVGFAVRSSAIGEDSEQLSAAGQNETFLGCLTSNDVINAVTSCWASLFTLQSVRYRHQHGLPIATQMAVVVQKMVPADCAGVLFTCHPSTESSAHLVITANHGLGESVVSGRSEPDTIIIDKLNLNILFKTLGSKSVMIKLGRGGVEEVEGVASFSVSDEQALLLAKVGILLEEKFGSARDIEWAFCQNKLYLLQSRPVTTLKSWTNYELLHEFDVATLSDDVVYTTANTGEILPGAISALTYSTIIENLDMAIQTSIDNKADKYTLKGLVVFMNHVFIDVIRSLHTRVDKVINIVSKSLDLAIVGHTIINERIHSLSISVNGITSPFGKLKDLLIMVKLAWLNESHANKCKNLSRNSEIGIDKERDTIKDVYVKIETSLPVFTKLAFLHCLTTRVSVTYQVVALTTLVENEEDFNVDHYNDAAMLLASCDDVVSAEIPNILGNITTILVENNQAEKFSQVKVQDGRQWLRDHAPDAAVIFDNFLTEHGHRCVGEFDLMNLSWEMNPDEVVKMIQTNCKMTAIKHEKQTKSVKDIINSLISPKKASTKRILSYIMSKSRKAVGIREQTKSETIRFVNKLRTAYKYLAEKMTLAGLIPDPNLIFHLTHYEIGQIIDGYEQSPALIIKAFKRQKLYPKWNLLSFPEVSYGVPRHEGRKFIPRTGLKKIICEGTPVCSGSVQARACVITDLKDIDQLQEGDVLITYCTDIGWSPYFPILGGIVTELGGLVSHGAVIAREYGLPCIVGAKGATKIFKTDDNVILSGKTGTIELI